MNSIRNRSPFVILILINVYFLVAGNFSTRAAEKDAAAKDLEKLQGEWVMLSGLADGGAVRIDLHLTQDDLASLSGTTRETVNRVLSSLRDQGLIRVERARVSVLKMQQLEDTRD